MDIGFSTAQWRRVREDYTAWWRGDLDRALIRLVLSKPSTGVKPSGFLSNWPPDMTDDEIVAVVREPFSRQSYYGDAFPYFFVNYGPGVAATFTGSRLHPRPETAWFEPVPHKRLADIRIALDQKSVWWRRIKRVTKLLAERIGKRVQISMTDIGGNLDILASLRGTDNLLMDVLDQPREVRRCSREITAMWLAVYDELHQLIAPYCPGSIAWAPTWAPDRTYMLQSDFCYMISPDLFREFVAPDLKACCDSLKYSFYHLDGVGELAHLDQILAIENLHGIQWIPGDGKPDAAEWSDVLSRIRAAGKLVQIQTTPQGALDVVRRHGGKGFLLSVGGHRFTEAAARRFVKEIASAQRPAGGGKRRAAKTKDVRNLKGIMHVPGRKLVSLQAMREIIRRRGSGQ